MKVPDPAAALAAVIDPDHPVKSAAAAWAEAELVPDDLVDADRASRFWREGWRRCAEYGVQGLVVPEEYGGGGHDVVHALLVLEGLGYGCADAGLVYGLGSQIWSMQQTLLRFGSHEQKARYLPSLCSGERIGIFAMTEPEAGSDTSAVTCRFERDGDDYVLSGHKAYITLGPVGDVAIVFATSDPSLGAWGLSAFLVEPDGRTAVLAPNTEKMGLRTTPFGDLHLDGHRVPAADRLGPEGAGSSIFRSALTVERAFIYAGQLGGVERLIDDCVAYARTRHQFGRPIGDFQAVSHRIADMKVRHETARLALYKAAVLHEAGRPTETAAAVAKLHASESAVASALDAVQIHGARGYLPAEGVERRLRDAVGGLVYSGTVDVQRNILVRLLGLG